MSCEELRDLYELYALGALESEEAQEIGAHLARGCRNCERGVASAHAMNALVLVSATPAVKPPRRLKHRVLAGTGYERPGWFWAGALAAALMLALALFLGVEERRRTAQLAQARDNLIRVTADRDRLAEAAQFLADPGTRPVSFGRGQETQPRGFVCVNPSLGVMLIASHLPPAGSGKIYEMWVVPQGGGAPHPAGLFASDGKRALHFLNGPVDPDTLQTIEVTVEPEGGSAAPTGPPRIVAPVGG